MYTKHSNNIDYVENKALAPPKDRSFREIVSQVHGDNREFAICHVVRDGNVNSIQNPSTVTNPTMEPFCIPIAMSCNVTNRELTSK